MVDELARRQIRAATRAALQRAGVVGVVPTPLEAVSKVTGITETVDIGQLPEDLVARRPNAFKRILGAVFYRPKIIFVDRSQGSARGRFIEAHEISHKLLPAHEALIRLDDEGRLFGNTKKLIEAEAELGAAELLFQGDLFVRRALEFPVSIAAPIGLAGEFGASLTAAVRHYADYHPDLVAVLVAGRFRNGHGRLPIWSGHESASFRQAFGPVIGHLASGLPAQRADDDPIGSIVCQALEFGEMASVEIQLFDLRGDARAFVAEAFFNQRVILVMLADAAASRRISRQLDLRVV